MWISRVEDIDAQRDNVQISNPFMMQNNANSLSSPFAAVNNSARRVGATATTPNGAGVILSISGQRTEPVNQSTALSGIDVNLFAAD